MHMFPNHAVRVAKRAHAHLLGDGFPVVHDGVQKDRVSRALAVECQRAQIVQDQIALCGLIVLELDDLRSVFGGPKICDFGDGVGRKAAVPVLVNEELVGGRTDHEFELGVELRLGWWVEGDGNFWFGRKF